MMEVLGGEGGGAAALFPVFIFVLLLNCSQSPVLFLGCYNYKSLKLNTRHTVRKVLLKCQRLRASLFLISPWP